MKTNPIFILLLALVGLLSSCDHEVIRASGEVTALDYSFTGYTELDISDAFDAYVFFSDTEEGVRIEANENLHDDIVIQKSGNTLNIRLRNNTTIRGRATLRAYVTTTHLSSFDISGASTVTLDNEWDTEDGKIELSGASYITGPVLVDKLKIDLSGASDVELYGDVNFMEAELSGSSELRDYDLGIDRLDIYLSGASDAFLTVRETMNVSASGASVLNFKGNAVINQRNLSGSSEIRNRN